MVQKYVNTQYTSNIHWYNSHAHTDAHACNSSLIDTCMSYFQQKKGEGVDYISAKDQMLRVVPPFTFISNSKLATGRWFSPGPPLSSTNKTVRQDITEILLEMAQTTIKQTNKQTIQNIGIHNYVNHMSI